MGKKKKKEATLCLCRNIRSLSSPVIFHFLKSYFVYIHYQNMKVALYQSFLFLFHKQKHYFVSVMCYNGKSIVRKKIANMIKWMLRQLWQRWSAFFFQPACTENEVHSMIWNWNLHWTKTASQKILQVYCFRLLLTANKSIFLFHLHHLSN